jgi:hypothetical protein
VARALGKTSIANLMLGATLLLGACTAQSVAAGTTSLSVEVAGDQRVSVRAEGVPLEAVLAELARKTALDVVWICPRGGEAVTERLDRVPVEAALERLLRGRNHSLFLSEGRPARVVIGSSTARAVARPPSTGDADLDDEIVDLRLVALEDGDGAYRAAAVELLATREETQARDAVAAALGDADAGVREVALGALAERSADADPLVLASVVERTAELGRSGLRLLGETALKDVAAEAALVQVANTDPDPRMRAEAGKVLDEIAALRRST